MIGYYVHHHGAGHLAHATAIARQCSEPVVALSSLAEPAAGHPFAAWVRLPDDPRVADPVDPTAGGALHWAPLNSPRYRDRMAVLAGWLDASRPRLLVVDVSAEVAVLARSLGTPVVTVALPGERDDPAHTLALRVSSLVLAPWPRGVFEPSYLRAVADKVVYLGAMSRFDERDVPGAPQPGTVALLAGSGGSAAGPAVLHGLQAAGGWRCHGFGGGLPWSGQVWEHLCAAEVVVTHAGLNAVAETAAAGRAAIVVAEPRPFHEQHVTARVLESAGLAAVLDGWPTPDRWPGLLADARRRGGSGWTRWNDRGAAQRAARCLAGVAA